MVTTAQNYSKESNATTFSRFAIWISRFPLILATVIFTAISSKFLLNPVQSAAAAGISFTSGVGITVARIGFGAFPLSFAIITLACVISRRRVLAGLYMVLTVISVALVVRIVGMLIDNSVRESVHVLIPEVVLLLLSLVALNVELRRRAQRAESALAG